jgi:hypothetical protein
VDRLDHYRQSICQFLNRYVEAWQEKDIETQLIIDSERDHYLLFRVGWEGEKRTRRDGYLEEGNCGGFSLSFDA